MGALKLDLKGMVPVNRLLHRGGTMPSERDEALNKAAWTYAASKGHKRLTDVPAKDLEKFVAGWVSKHWHKYTKTGRLRKGQ